MHVAIIASEHDTAGMNIMRILKTMDWPSTVSLAITHHEQVHAENIDEGMHADVLIFVSRHSSRSGVPSFSVHPIGNFGAATLGGKEKTLIPCPALLMKHALVCVARECERFGHEVTMEVTHHGPFCSKPMFFMEIGSSEEQWKNTEYAAAMARAVHAAVTERARECTIAIGLGGTHYAQKFTNIQLHGEYAIGHMCAKHQLEYLDEKRIHEMIEKSGNAKAILVDWKGLGPHKERVRALVQSTGLPMIRI